MADESSSSVESLPIEGTVATAFNRYGSPIASQREPAASVETVPREEQQDDASQRVQSCTCKNTCSRKRTARSAGCPCKNDDRSCSEECKCGTKSKPCKNKRAATDGPTQSNEPSAFVRHEQDLVAAQRQIEEFVTPLSGETKTALLIRLLSQGRGSIDYVQNLVRELENPAPEEPRNGRLPWCMCGVCVARDNEEENKCCKKVTCVTSYEAFHSQCIDPLSLTLAIRQRCDMRADAPDYSVNSFRKAAYRIYIIWKYGKLGRGNRRVVPSCVVRVIRKAYPAHNEMYMGFRAR